MSIRWVFNPLEMVCEIALDIFGEINCEIAFGKVKGRDKKETAWTMFPDEEGKPFEIVIDAEADFEQITEALAHELAHVIAGEDENEGHGEEWMAVFERIHQEYIKRCEELFADNEDVEMVKELKLAQEV